MRSGGSGCPAFKPCLRSRVFCVPYLGLYARALRGTLEWPCGTAASVWIPSATAVLRSSAFSHLFTPPASPDPQGRSSVAPGAHLGWTRSVRDWIRLIRYSRQSPSSDGTERRENGRFTDPGTWILCWTAGIPPGASVVCRLAACGDGAHAPALRVMAAHPRLSCCSIDGETAIPLRNLDVLSFTID